MSTRAFKKRRLLLAIVLLSALARGASAQMLRAPIRDPQHVIYTNVISYQELQRFQVVMQKYDYSCGAATLATIVKFYWGDNVDETTFLDLLPKLKLTEAELKDRIENGLTLTDLRNLANDAGYEAVMGRVQFDELAKGKVPVIVGITVNKHDHFAVFRGTDGQWAYLADPIRGNIRVPIPEFLKQWQKNAILVVAKRNTAVKDVNPMAVRVQEMQRGQMNTQWVHRNALQPAIPQPVHILP